MKIEDISVGDKLMTTKIIVLAEAMRISDGEWGEVGINRHEHVTVFQTHKGEDAVTVEHRGFHVKLSLDCFE